MAKCTLDLLPAETMKLTDSMPVDPVPVPGRYKLAGLDTGEGGGGRGRRGG